MKTDQYCTNCGKEFEPFEDVVAIGIGTVIRAINDYYVETSDSMPLSQTLCEECGDKLLHPKPNRVVIEVEDNVVQLVHAERPEELLVFVHDRDLSRYYNRQHTVQKLKEELA